MARKIRVNGVRSRVLMVWALAGLLSLGRSTNVADAQEDDIAVLKKQTQELLDAVTAGDASVWNRYLDHSVMYLSEDGQRKTKNDLLEEIEPLPPGISGELAIGMFVARVHGDTAVTTHDDLESENYFGHMLKAEYRTTDTWRRTSSGWTLIASQVHAQLIDPPAIQLSARRLDEYVGVYRLNDEITYTIQRKGNALVGQRSGRQPQSLSVEASDVMFVPGQARVRKIFQRSPNGRVTGFADRREGRDVPWTRVR